MYKRQALWLHGEEDQLVPYDGTAVGWSRIADAGAEAATYAGARHEIFNETNKREVVHDVLTFVLRHAGRACLVYTARCV